MFCTALQLCNFLALHHCAGINLFIPYCLHTDNADLVLAARLSNDRTHVQTHCRSYSPFVATLLNKKAHCLTLVY